MGKSWVSLIGILLFATSCTKYYYSTVSAPGYALQNEMGDFYQEDDRVSVIYSFYGEDLPIHITVYNKTDRPLYVDWQKSALIIEDEANSYASNQASVRVGTFSRTYTYRDYLFFSDESVSYGEATGHVNLPQGVSFIPPKTKIGHVPITLSNFTFEKIPSGEFSKIPFATKDSQTKKVGVINYTPENSPLRFRSYLTIYDEGPDGRRKNTWSYEQSFYISQLIKAGNIEPSNFQAYNQQRGNFFFVRDERGKRSGIIAGVVALGVAGVVIEAAVGPPYY